MRSRLLLLLAPAVAATGSRGCSCGPTPTEVGRAIVVASPLVLVVAAGLLALLAALWRRRRPTAQAPTSAVWLLGAPLVLGAALCLLAHRWSPWGIGWTAAALSLYGSSQVALALLVWRLWLIRRPESAATGALLVATGLFVLPAAALALGARSRALAELVIAGCLWGGVLAIPLLVGLLVEAWLRTQGPPGAAAPAPSRGAALLLGVGFLGAGLVTKLSPFGSFLGRRSLVAWAVSGLVAVVSLAALTALARARELAPVEPDLDVLPRPSRASLRLLGWTAAIGVALAGVVSLGTWLSGDGALRLQGGVTGLLARLPGAALAAVLDASWAELAFAGWGFSVAVRALGPHPATLGLAALFGATGLLQRRVSVLGVAAAALPRALLGYTMLATRDLLAPLGLHAGWTFFQAVLASHLSRVTRSPGALPEEHGGSVAGLIVLALALAAAVWFYETRRRRTHAGA